MAILHKFNSCLNPPLQDEILNPFPSIPPMVQLAVMAGMANVLMGYNLSVLNTAMPVITAEFQWCQLPDKEHWEAFNCDTAKPIHGIICTTLIFGAACGSLITSSLMSRIGRRLSLVFVYIGLAVGGALASFSQGFFLLLFARVLTGVFAGIATVAPAVYITEMSPMQHRSFYGLIPTIGTNLGVFLGICVGLPLKFPSPDVPLDPVDWRADSVWWRQMLAMPILFSILGALCLIKVYPFDTPEALRLAGKSATPVEVFLWSRTNSPPTPSSRTDDLKTVPSSLNPDVSTTSLNKALCIPALRSRLFVGWILSAGQQFSGMAVFIATSNSLFAQAGVPSEYLSIASASMALLQLVCSIIAVNQLDKWPRKLTLGGGSLFMGFCLFPVISSSILPISDSINQCLSILSTLSFASVYGLTIGPGLFVYLSELFPIEIKDVGLSVAFAINWVSSLLVILLASHLSELNTFIFFTVVCATTSVFITAICPETRSKYEQTGSIEFSVLVSSEPVDSDHSL